MKYPILISFMIIIILISITQIGIVSNVGSMNIDNSNTTKITTWNTNRYNGFPTITLAQNGNLVLGYINGTAHGGAIGQHTIYVTISNDNGSTWGQEFKIWNSGGNTILPTTTANGTLIAIVGTGGAAHYICSYDNGTTWTDSLGVFNSTVNVIGCRSGFVDGNTAYFCGFEDWITNIFLKSTDNCSTFQVINDSIGNWGDEWGMICINSTHFLGVSRCDEQSATKQLETWDAGVTWTVTDITSNVGIIQAPHLNWLNKEEGVILLVGRNATDADYIYTSAYWISNDTGVSWKNYTAVMSPAGGQGTVDGGYSESVYFEGQQKSFVVTYSGYYNPPPPTNIYGYWVYDNTTYSPQSEIQFISINGENNGTNIYNSTPTFNWSVTTNASKYQLQIATDNTFTSLVVNLSDINIINYPSNYNENATRISFKLSDVNKLPTYDTYYCRVRAKTKV